MPFGPTVARACDWRYAMSFGHDEKFANATRLDSADTEPPKIIVEPAAVIAKAVADAEIFVRVLRRAENALIGLLLSGFGGDVLLRRSLRYGWFLRFKKFFGSPLRIGVR